jgi:hypothetical protein
MKVLMLWGYYPYYLSYFYEKYPFVKGMPFEEHRNKILDDHFGWPAELSRYMNHQGIQTEFIIANAEILQKKWAEENNFRYYSKENWLKEIAMEQIKRFRPDVLWTSSVSYCGRDFVKRALSYCKKAISWVSGITPNDFDVSGFSTLITSNPEVLKDQQYLFDDIIITKPGFDHGILKEIGPIEKKYDITFVGGISMLHSKRAEILSYLIKEGVDIKIFGYLSEQKTPKKINIIRQTAVDILKRRDFHKDIYRLRQSFIKTDYQRNVETIKSVHQGLVFGLDMYRTLAASLVTLNVHIDIVGNYSGNIRMFEATGIGTCLVTEYTKDIREMFEPDKEILTYNSKEDLLEIIQTMLNKREKVEQIAKDGQKRTLQNHTLERMFNDIRSVFDI